ncbi:ATP-binding sensor histidine kinase [Microcoleus sp. F4-D5]|uniref:ATP-binding sensor histidine kinase n=1 Tax=Microcoleus sp. F4-D5 TaxID=2818760 RepID=UPI002FD15E9C
MINLAGYEITNQIHESNNSLVYRGLRKQDNQPVILKFLKQDYPMPASLVRYKQEYEITRNLQLESVPKTYSLERYHNSLVIIFEDCGGESLKLWLASHKLTLEEFLATAIKITRALGHLHQHKIIHKDINPSNIIINSTTGRVQIIDFGISTVLSRENPTLKNPNVLEGTLSYISPEQTGRMNRSIDYRTDFYSLGVTFYELLTGQLPCDYNDAIELVHCHIAKQAVPPQEINPEIPKAVSDIVMKLLAKTAEARYQSAWGIIADLEECLQQLETKGSIADFAIAQKDITDKFQIPQKLYGREREVETLLAAFDRVSNGTTEIMLVSGYSGIGKSALVQEVYKPITKASGYFIAGKFDQFQRNIPYSAIVKAFQSLVKQVLTENETQLNAWKEKLLAAFGDNGQIVIDVIPDVELIVGKQPPVQELGAAEAQNRFNLVFQKFIRLFCSVEHPLVIFLDDLQWADSATLKLLQVMMADNETKYLFLIGAYRDNEVSPSHPLIMTLDELQKQKATINQITLTPLHLEQIANVIADTLRRDTKAVMPLAELVVGKTQGNPFFVNQFLRTLYEENLLIFNYEQRKWDWNISEIEAVGITYNVVELMVGKLRKMPDSTQQVLRLAACVGNSFDLNTLSIVNEKSTAETFQELLPAIQDGLILATSELGVTEEEIVQSHLIITTYKFLHDRVQQAAYALIDESSKKTVHLQIGRLLWQNTSSEMRSEEIFAIVDHLNLGIEGVGDQSERTEIAKLNLTAGQKAKAATAYAAATEYLQVSLGLLAEDSWIYQYELTLILHTEAAEAAFLSGDFDRMQKLAEVVQNSAKTLLDKIKVYEVQIQAYVSQNKLLEAVNIALEILKLLGVEFPSQPNPSDIGQAFTETSAILNGMGIEELIDLPQMNDPNKLAAMKLMSSIFAPVYIAAPALLPLTICKQVHLSVEYGNASVSPFAYANYGFLLCGIVGDIDSGYQLGQLALSLLSRLNAQEIKAKTPFIVNIFIRHCKEHLRETLEPLVSVYSSGLETGDLEFGAFGLLLYSYFAYYSGKELTALETTMANYRNAIYKLKQETALNFHEIYWQAVLNLLGKSEDPCRLQGEAYDEEIRLPLHEQANDRLGVAYLYWNKLSLSYWFENYSEAIENTTIAEKYLDVVVGLPLVPLFHFYDSLIWLAVYYARSELEQNTILDRVRNNQQKMQKWAHNAPMNHLHKFYLVEAETHRVLGEKIEAIEMYDKAIAMAKENEYINEEALAHELAAKFYLSWDKETIAQVYMQNAHYSYQVWGAIAKVKHLEEKYPQLLTRTSAKTTTQTKVNRTTTTPTTTSTNLGDTLDLATVMKASQAISGEIVLSKLLERLMKIAIENAGAEKGFLILEKAGNWAIEAEGSVKGDEVSVLRSLPLNAEAASGETPKLASTIVHYVIRTQENVVLNNATQEGQFTRDPYIAATQPKSILCTPLLHQGKLTGIFYLENNLTEGAFTTDRLELLKLLSAQIAISLENAQLYNNLQEFNQNLEQLVCDRTQELSNTLDALKATQSKLVESEKMASLGGLVAGVAHEINTPVGVGVTVASALADHTTEFASIYKSGKMKRSELEEFLDIATQSSNTLLTNLNQAAELIQSFKEVAVDRSSEERRTFGVRNYLDEILIQLKPKLRNSKHSIEIKGDTKMALDSYPGALSQVITNLLMNSLIHAYEPGESGQFVFDWQQDGDRLRFEYSDDGKGIPPENLSKIFEPFFTTKRGQGGSGLGLHIVYNLVTQKLLGEIECKSEVGAGTKFIIKLPAQIDSKP